MMLRSKSHCLCASLENRQCKNSVTPFSSLAWWKWLCLMTKDVVNGLCFVHIYMQHRLQEFWSLLLNKLNAISIIYHLNTTIFCHLDDVLVFLQYWMDALEFYRLCPSRHEHAPKIKEGVKSLDFEISICFFSGEGNWRGEKLSISNVYHLLWINLNRWEEIGRY